jgi:hypothetical protein
MEFKVSTLFIEQSLKKHFHKHSLLGDKKYFDPYLVPVAKELEDSFPLIQAELKAILKRYDEFANFKTSPPTRPTSQTMTAGACSSSRPLTSTSVATKSLPQSFSRS